MKVIEGFQSAEPLLSRRAPGEMPGGVDLEAAVRQIIDEVRRRGDAALFDYTFKFDGVKLTSLEVSKEEIKRAYQDVDADLVAALRVSAERIRSYHNRQRERIWNEATEASLGWLVRPLERVGIYVPGFTAPLPSSVLMTAVPARVAGVKEIILTTPPASSGAVAPPTLVAADIAGADRVFSIGGAQAIAAMAFGTESVPCVDKVCGPGNIYVTLAKKMVYGVVGIDGLFGPSEVLIIADDTANPEYCAADLLAQAEHDALASAILITTSRQMATEVDQAVKQQLEDLSRKVIATESLENRGMIVLVGSIDEAVALANLYAPEHLCLFVNNAASFIEQVTNAGCIFVGEYSIEALVDYVAGPSHVLPTQGTARFSSPLNVSDFVKMINLVTMDKADLQELGPAASRIARAEGLDAHARAVERRLGSPGQGGN